MRALVTGATGCVGANIIEALLARGYAVRALRRVTSRLDALWGLEPEFVIGDVCDYASLVEAMAECEVVFHAAAISKYWYSWPDAIYHVNVTGTRNVLRAALAQRIERFVFTSSVAALGLPMQRGQLIDESAPFNVHPKLFHYGHSKWLAEVEVRRAMLEGLDVVIVNPASIIGQRDVNFVGGEILRAARRGLFVGAPPGMMGVVSARDVGIGHVLALDRGRSGARYILNGENISHRALMAIVAQVTESRAPRFTLPRALVPWFARGIDLWNVVCNGEPWIEGGQVRLSAHDLCYDGGRAVRELGFPQTSARAAVQEAWAWYRAHSLL